MRNKPRRIIDEDVKWNSDLQNNKIYNNKNI